MAIDDVIDARRVAAFLLACACGPMLESADTTTSDQATSVDPEEGGALISDVAGPAESSGSVDSSTGNVGTSGGSTSSDDGGERCPGDPVHPDPDAPACAPDRPGTWSPMNSADALAWGETMIWTGDRVLVWGGGLYQHNGGGTYDPATDSWSAISTSGAPSPRYRHASVWTGSEMIIWGGLDENGVVPLADGARYRPDADEWAPLSEVGAPTPRVGPAAAWTGDEMIVFGGVIDGTYDAAPLGDGARYDPELDAWQPLASDAFIADGSAAVWSGSELIVWGGLSAAYEPLTGGRYDPILDEWQPMTTDGAPSFSQPIGVWTGTSALFYGGGCCQPGGDPIHAVAAYDPVADVWGPEVALCGDSVSYGVAVWTGCDLLVWLSWSTNGNSPEPMDVFRFDGDTVWRSAPVDFPEPQIGARAVWTGEAMIVWGGEGGQWPSGGIYRP